MNLGKNVHNLLKRQPEVFIKGLGAFKRNHTPAAYDEKRDLYLPPISYIDFDQASTRGYDFIAYVAQLESIDLQSAEHQVSLAVKALLRNIQEEGQAKLDDLGYLVSYGGGYVFKALDLSGFNYEPVEGIKPVANPLLQDVEAERLSGTKLPMEQVPVPTHQPVPEEILQPFFETDSFSAKRPGSNALWYIVIAVLALGVITALYYFNRPVLTEEKTVTVVEAPEDTIKSAAAIVDVDSTMRQDSLAGTLKDSVIDTVPVMKIPAKVVNKKHNWQIVIGTHRTIDQAEEHAAAMHNKGYDKVRVIPSNMAKNKKKVIWDSYETKQEMETALQYVRKNIEKDAWPDKIN